MIIHQLEQRTPEWYEIRLGKPTGSKFGNIYTSQGKPSASQGAYINELASEWLFGEQVAVFENDAMKWGTKYEPEACDFFQFHSDIQVTPCGFVTDDDLRVGVSPDGLTEAGGIEIKCPKPSTHVKYLRNGKLPSEYKAQVLGCLWITGREWWDFMSYHPQMPNLLIRVYRDEEYINQLERLVTHACQIIEKEVTDIKERL